MSGGIIRVFVQIPLQDYKSLCPVGMTKLPSLIYVIRFFYGTQGSFLLLNFVVVNLGDTVGLTGAPLFK